jgi:Zn-dependent M16 (insulinase) family peptidase
MFSYLAQEQFNRKVARALEKGDTEARAKVLQRLENVREKVLSSPLNVHFAGDPQKIEGGGETPQKWAFLANNTKTPLQVVRAEVEEAGATKAFQCSPDFGQNWDLLGKVRAIAVGGSESAFLLQKAKFDGNWADALAETGRTMETLLLCQYLCQCEGPLWNAVRGTGLAYDASIYLLPDRRSITLSLYRCAQLVQAYERTKQTVVSAHFNLFYP